jgi:hypothetical protein
MAGGCKADGRWMPGGWQADARQRSGRGHAQATGKPRLRDAVPGSRDADAMRTPHGRHAHVARMTRRCRPRTRPRGHTTRLLSHLHFFYPSFLSSSSSSSFPLFHSFPHTTHHTHLLLLSSPLLLHSHPSITLLLLLSHSLFSLCEICRCAMQYDAI